jgi:hypothetical protein
MLSSHSLRHVSAGKCSFHRAVLRLYKREELRQYQLHTEHTVLFPQEKWLCERATVLCYTSLPFVQLKSGGS